MNAIELLKAGHREALELVRQIERSSDPAEHKRPPRDLVGRLKRVLAVHGEMEENVFYPAMDQFDDTRNLVEQAQRDHRMMDELIARLSEQEWTEKDLQVFTALDESLGIHINEEERALLPKAATLLGKDTLESMGRKMEQMGRLHATAASDGR